MVAGIAFAMVLQQAAAATLAGARAEAGMVAIPAGSYRPLHPVDGQPRVRVAAFRVDRKAVTRRAFLTFVRTHPDWRRSMVAPAAADGGYLASWHDDLAPGPADALNAPITEISWYAAQAYCRAQGKRLPTTAEWEYLAAASETQRDATGSPAFLRRLTHLYANHGPGFTNVYGVSGLHGVIWEWTADDGPAAQAAGAHLEHDARRAGHQHAAGGDPTCAGAAIGAADATDYAAFLREALRASLTPSATAQRLGFRCAAG